MTWPQYLRRECTFNGDVIKLGRVQTEILSTLLMRSPAPVSASDLIEAVYPNPDKEPDWADSCIKVLVHRVRKKLPGVIEVRYGMGYTIR